jgi:hypothetical protein
MREEAAPYLAREGKVDNEALGQQTSERLFEKGPSFNPLTH